jgi:simple sugar transport system substrate-binding protein
VYAIGYHSDMSKYGPKAHLTASTHDWSGFYAKMVGDALAGKAQPSNVWGGIKDGMVKMAPMNAAVPKDVRDLVAKAEADIAAGKLHPFAGPVKDQGGKGACRPGDPCPTTSSP